METQEKDFLTKYGFAKPFKPDTLAILKVLFEYTVKWSSISF
jgi:hypothetical protein